MLSNLFRRLTGDKKRVNKKQYIEMDSPVSNGNKGKYIKLVSFFWSLLEAALSILNVKFLLKKQFFLERINEN